MDKHEQILILWVVSFAILVSNRREVIKAYE